LDPCCASPTQLPSSKTLPMQSQQSMGWTMPQGHIPVHAQNLMLFTYNLQVPHMGRDCLDKGNDKFQEQSSGLLLWATKAKTRLSASSCTCKFDQRGKRKRRPHLPIQKSTSKEKPTASVPSPADAMTPAFWYSPTLFSKKFVFPCKEMSSIQSKGLLAP